VRITPTSEYKVYTSITYQQMAKTTNPTLDMISLSRWNWPPLFLKYTLTLVNSKAMSVTSWTNSTISPILWYLKM